MTLLVKQRLFIDEYLKCFNGAEAARRAGYAKKAVYQIAYENLRKPEIMKAIQERLKESAMSSDEVIARLTQIARSNIGDFIQVQKDGFAYVDLSKPEASDSMAAIRKVRTKRSRRIDGKGKAAKTWEDEQIEIETHDAMKALEILGKYHNLFTEKDEDGNPLTDEQRVARVMAILDTARARRDGEATTDSTDAASPGPATTG